MCIRDRIGTAAAPTLSSNSVDISNLTVKDLKQWIALAEQLETRDMQTQKGIAVLEQLLATLSLAKTLPKETTLLANYPNPFNPETWIPYDLAQDTDVDIDIYNLKGEIIRKLNMGYQAVQRELSTV